VKRFGLGALGLAVVGAALWIAFALIHVVVQWIASLPKEEAGPLIVAIGTVVVAFLTYVLQQRAAADARVREARTGMYEEFISFFLERVFQLGGGEQQAADPQELKAFFTRFTRQVVLLSSDRFLRTWSQVRTSYFTASGTNEGRAEEAMFAFELVLKEMRREFGHRNWQVGEGVLLGLWVNDLAPVVARRKAAKGARGTAGTRPA
jgi:hypothetical protein